MVNRKRLLCTALSCLLSFSNLGISRVSGKNGKLNQDQVYKLMIECLDNADKAISNLNFDKSSGYLTLPLCNGFYSVNAFCSPKSIKNRDFIRGITIDMMLSTFMYHLNVAHMMSPEERKANWNTVSVRIARWLGEGALPEGTQNSYAFWTQKNAKIFNRCQENASKEAYDLMEELLNNYDDMYEAYENVFSDSLKKVLASDSSAKDENVNNGQKVSNLNDAEVKEIKDYILEQIKDAYDHLTFLRENNYIVLPVCDGYWATNLYCSPELVKNPDFSRGVVIDIILSIFMFSLNKTYHMSSEEREANKDKIYVKIARWLGEGKLPEGVQNSYAFWKNNNNIKLFNVCQCNACDYAYDLMEEHFKLYESQNGPGSIQRIFESLYSEPDGVDTSKLQEQAKPSGSDEIKNSASIAKGENINDVSSKEKNSSKNSEDNLSETETDVEEDNLDKNVENNLPVEV